MDLQGRTVIVTGAGQGLGRAYALGLADAGAAVVVNDADAAAAEAVTKTIEAAGGKAVAAAAAVGPTAAADLIISTAVETFGRVDGIVTNAGILRDTVLWKMSDDDFDAVINVHLRGTFTCVRAAVHQMREQGDGGKIVVVGSPTGQTGNFGQTNYGAAKAGIVGMMRTWTLELARANIDVNAIVPVAATAMTRTIPWLTDHVAAWEDHGTPLPESIRKGRGFGVPEDVVGLLVFLMSAASNGVRGNVMGIGGDKVSLWAEPAERLRAYSDGGWTADELATAWPSFGAGPAGASDTK